MLFSPRQQTVINQFAAVGYHRNVLETKVRLVAEFVLRFDLLNHDDILDADTKAAIFVVSRLVGDHVAGGKGNFGILDSSADADGPFVYV